MSAAVAVAVKAFMSDPQDVACYDLDPEAAVIMGGIAEDEASRILAHNAGQDHRAEGQCFAADMDLRLLASIDGVRSYDSLGTHRFRDAAIEALAAFVNDCDNCADGPFGCCPRCYAESGLGCPHGPLCHDCKMDEAH